MILFYQFIDDVQNDKIVVCELVRLAVERHINDMDKADDVLYPYFFDEEEAARAIRFVKLLRHTKGAYKGKSFDLQPFQAFMIGCLFGWRRKGTQLRRFSKSYNEIARKNGKTELAAAIGLYMFIADEEGSAEIYTAATKKDQAKICFDAMVSMARMLKKDSKAIDKMVGIHKNNIHILSEGSKIEPLSADYNTLDGHNPHCAIIDEYHAHKTDEITEVMLTGMGGRLQPLLFIITTAGFNKQSPCYAERKNAIEVLKGIKDDDSLFVMVFTLDENDDWKDEKNWIKANPNIGAAPYWHYMRAELQNAINKGSTKEVQFKTKNLNLWTDSAEVWIRDDVYQAAGRGFDITALYGLPCYGGLDLASTLDTTSWCLFFPSEDLALHPHRAIWHYWCPADTAKERGQSDKVNYLAWAEEGFIELTPGNVTDYNFIKQRFIESNELFTIKSTAYDRYNSSQLVIDLQNEGFELNPFGQGFLSMSNPTKELEKMIIKKDLDHNFNAVTRWQFSNIAIKRDPADNIKIDKAKSGDKVDGAVALVMAIGEWLTALSKNEKESNVRIRLI